MKLYILLLPFIQIADAVFDGIPVTVYSPREPKSELTGGLVVLHGGGFMAGGASTTRLSNAPGRNISEFCFFREDKKILI